MLELRGLTYTYPDREVPALKRCSLSIDAGEMVLLAGISASGKSTLLRLACGLVPHFSGGYLSGEAIVAGLNIREQGPAELAASVGYVAQDPETQVVMNGVRAELEFPLENRGYSAAEIARAVEETALVLGIERLLERPTATLSGGELQRVALAAALVTRPALLLLDEPTSQLDPVAGDELIWSLKRMNEQWGITVVIAEHRIDRVLPAVDRVVTLEDGAVLADLDASAFSAWAGANRLEFEPPVAQLIRMAGRTSAPRGVKEARRALHLGGHLAVRGETSLPAVEPARGEVVVSAKNLWREIDSGPTLLRGIDLGFRAGERVALMGRNGAGKSTLLRQLAGIDKPTRGKIEQSGRVALLMQNPGDYLVHDLVKREVSEDVLQRVGLDHLLERNPRDLSGGERQRLALGTVIEGDDSPALLALDEPTRGMDAYDRDRLIGLLDGFSELGVATVVATHDTEFAAEFAQRVVLMGEGVVIADSTPRELLSTGWHFATDTARVLNGAGGALTPEEGANILIKELDQLETQLQLAYAGEERP